MSVSGLQRVNMFVRRIMGATDMGTRLQGYLETAIERHTKAMTTGPTPDADPGGWFLLPDVSDGSGSNTLDFGDMYGVDGTGRIISEEAGATYTSEVPFQDTAAVTYYMAVCLAEVPKAMLVNQSNGSPEYDYTELMVAHADAPTAVVDGGSTITLTLNNHRLHASDTMTGRTAVAWLNDPESPSYSTAVFTGVIVGTALTITGTLGQSTVSTTASDYRVAILGPVITRQSSVMTDARYAFIGTVSGGGAPRAFDSSGASLLTTLSEASDMFRDALARGWMTIPTLTAPVGGTSVSWTTGIAYSGGRLLSAAAGSSGSFANNTRYWLSFDPSTGVTRYTSANDAFSGERVPLATWLTNGSAQIASGDSIGRTVKKFNETLLLTVSGSATHNGAFTRLRNALAAIYSAQGLTTSEPPRAIIELVGDVTVTTQMASAEHFPANVHFRGGSAMAGRVNAKFDSFFESLGAGIGHGRRITWSFASALFKPPSDLVGWTFEGIHFCYKGTADDVADALFDMTAGGDVEGLAMVGCAVMGTGSVAFAASPLPHLIYGPSACEMVDVHFRDCYLAIEEALFHVDGITDCTFRDCTVNQGTTTVTFGSPGFIMVDAGGTISGLRIEGCQFLNMNGPLLDCAGSVQNLWIINNDIDTRPDTDCMVIDIGNGSGAIRGVRIKDNRISYFIAGAPANPLIYVDLDAVAQLNLNAVYISGNHIEGDSRSAAGHVAVSVNVGTLAAAGLNISDNMMSEVGTGVKLAVAGGGTLKQVVIHNNIVLAGVAALDLGGASNVAVNNNVLHTESASSIVLELAAGTDVVIMGNVMENNDTAGSIISLGAANRRVLAGNVLNSSGGIDAVVGYANHAILMGNLAGTGTDGFQLTSANRAAVVGNLVDKAVVDAADGISLSANVMAPSSSSVMLNVTADHASISANVNMAATTVTGHDNAIVGNVLQDALTLPSAGLDITVVGNVFDVGQLMLEADFVVVVGNVMDANTNCATVDAAANQATFLGNWFENPISDSGTATFGAGTPADYNNS